MLKIFFRTGGPDSNLWSIVLTLSTIPKTNRLTDIVITIGETFCSTSEPPAPCMWRDLKELLIRERHGKLFQKFRVKIFSATWRLPLRTDVIHSLEKMMPRMHSSGRLSVMGPERNRTMHSLPFVRMNFPSQVFQVVENYSGY